MSTLETPVDRSALGVHGDPCRACGAPLAADQRYCLECGERRGPAPRFSRAGADAAPPATPPPSRPGRRTMAAGGAAAGALAVLVGVLLGAGLEDEAAPPAVNVAAPSIPAPVINVNGGGGAPAAEATFASDWPEGQKGWTVALERLPKEGGDVAAVDAAKTAASEKGAKDVGALDSDDHSSLDPGEYVIYSGVFDSKGKARRALRRLRGEFPDAAVVRVSAARAAGGDEAELGDSELEELQDASPEEFRKRSRRLPDKTRTEGRPPPKDEREPGAGDGGEVIE